MRSLQIKFLSKKKKKKITSRREKKNQPQPKGQIMESMLVYGRNYLHR